MAPLSTYKVSSFEQQLTWFIDKIAGVDLRAILLCIDMESSQNLFRVGGVLVCASLPCRRSIGMGMDRIICPLLVCDL